MKWSFALPVRRTYSDVIQRADSHPDIADDIASRIRQAVQPWRIVLFGSRARGDHREWSDYDVYVEVSEEGVTATALHDRIREALSGIYSLDIKVNPPGEIERRRDDPGTIEWDVAREGRVLFADPRAPSVLTPPKRVSEPPADVPESVSEWLEVAERDLRHCHLLEKQDPSYSPEICWLSHQTCEKHMKALLVAQHVRPDRTHDLKTLLAALRAAGLPLPGLDTDCELLSKHAITPRYPAGLKLGVDAATAALAAAERVVRALRAELPPHLR
jgi:HEPN domain-containing protein/predicted nucleotidyltransferase